MVPNSCQDLSVKITGLLIALLALGLSAWGADCPKNQPRTEAALVQLADLLCRMRGFNYGYIEDRQVNLLEESGFAVLAQHCPSLREFDWARLTFEMDSYMDDVHSLVRAIYPS